ncbi:protein kinase, putative [Bodo saltans]|uniref:Protein kinase, putative n=1 Tax=Bodo saltans TaxID=75058 RepID=A0A0S4JEH0_BODSA|nr:protein kinase, putative [Bodo saltans]|eukprot:CUG89763.1 protein kinase, putative [Bodo saltans]
MARAAVPAVGVCAALFLAVTQMNRPASVLSPQLKRPLHVVLLAISFGCVVAQSIWSAITYRQRVTSLVNLRLTISELVAHQDEGSGGATQESWTYLDELNIIKELSALVDSLHRLNTFVPIGARGVQRSVSPSVLGVHEQQSNGWDRVNENASFGDRPLVTFVVPPGEDVLVSPPPELTPEQEAQAQHVQSLLDAIKSPHASFLPPASREVSSAPVSRSPQPHLLANVSTSSPTIARSLMNSSLASPAKRALNKSISASPRGSPLSVNGALSRRSQRSAAFRPSVGPSYDSGVTTQQVGAVLVLQVGIDDSISIPPPSTIGPLSSAIGRAISIVSEYGGVVYSFDLSRIVASFHVQRPCVDYALCSVYAALAMSHVFEPLAEEGLTFGVGVSTSEMLSGDLGNDEVRSCVIHGAALENSTDLALLNFHLQTRVLISEGLHDQVQNNVVTMLVDFVRVRPLAPAHTISEKNVDVSQHIGVFEVRGAESNFEDSVCDGVMFASRLPHDVLVAYLEAFFFLRKGQYPAAVERLKQLAPEYVENDVQIQRIYQLSLAFSNHSNPPPTYLRCRYLRWGSLDLDTNDSTRQHASPSYAGRKSTHLSHESPTRIIEAVMRARSYPAPDPLGATTTAPTSLCVERISSTELDGSATCLNLSTTVSYEFADVGGILWRKSDKLLGRGAFGEVFLGMRVDDGKLVAMKQLRIPEIAASSAPLPKGRRRNQQREKTELDALVREIKMLCGLRHPNIVFFLGCGVVAQDIIINLEYISGGSLQAVLEEFGCIPVPAAQRYLKDVLRGLDFLHSKDIIHRDVKPGNVLLHVDGGCKVTDFGTSIQLQNILDNNIVVGTPVYMSPEQARGSMTTCFQSDLWSVGIMTIQLLTGTLPVNVSGAIEAHQYMHKLASDDRFEIPIPDVIPALASSFVAQCLRREPASRGSAQELLLHPFLFTASTPSHPTPLRQKSSAAFSPSPPGSHASPLSPLQPASL